MSSIALDFMNPARCKPMKSDPELGIRLDLALHSLECTKLPGNDDYSCTIQKPGRGDCFIVGNKQDDKVKGISFIGNLENAIINISPSDFTLSAQGSMDCDLLGNDLSCHVPTILP